MNFQPTLDRFIPKLKLKYDDLENIKTAPVNTVVFNLHEIKQLKFFGTPGTYIHTYIHRQFNLDHISGI